MSNAWGRKVWGYPRELQLSLPARCTGRIEAGARGTAKVHEANLSEL